MLVYEWLIQKCIRREHDEFHFHSAFVVQVLRSSRIQNNKHSFHTMAAILKQGKLRSPLYNLGYSNVAYWR